MAMTVRIIVGAVIVLAVVQALAPMAVPGGIVPLALVVLGLAYAALAIDAEDATAYLVVVVAVGAAGQAGVLDNIPGQIGMVLNNIVEHVSIALYAGVITVLVVRTFNRLKG